MSRFSEYFTQGGQTQLHRLHMWKQVFFATLVIALITYIIVFFLLIFKDYSIENFYHFGEYMCWKLMQLDHYEKYSNIFNKNLEPIWVMNFRISLLTKAVKSLWGFFLCFVFMSFFWIISGRKQAKEYTVEGHHLLNKSDFIKYIKKSETSDFSIGLIPYPKDMETKHTLILGTTGSGKTNCLYHMMDSFRKADGGIIVDTTGDLVSRYYRPDKDILLNPFDIRSMHWNLWKDAKFPYHFDGLAAAFISSKLRDDFWVNAARILFSVAAQKVENLEDFLYILLQAPLKEMNTFFNNSQAASLVDIRSEQMVGSIRGVLNNHIKSLYFLKNTPDQHIFSFREWSKNLQGSWIFLTAMPDQREALRPLLSSCLYIAISSIMSLCANSKRRIMIVIDELASLNKVDALSTALAELRKYGGGMIAGLQDIHQLESIYGSSNAKTMMGLFNTRIIFKLIDSDALKKISESLGEQEISQMMEGISFGANKMRDGVSLSDQRKIQPIISRTDLMNLKPLEAIIHFSNKGNIGRYQFDYANPMIKNLPFLEKDCQTQTMFKDFNSIVNHIKAVQILGFHSMPKL